MPITTNLSVTPYHDDYDESKDFYKILFRPGVSVQTRELNQLQSILQKQIERFGDNIFKRGAIVDGCNFIFANNYPYAKLIDNTIEGTPIEISLFQGLFARNDDGLTGYIINSEEGFESSSPDLKTIYVNYTNSGNNKTDTAFSPDDTLTIFDSNNSVFSVSINNGGLHFSNSDYVIFSSALIVNVASGSFTNGEYIGQVENSSNVQIVGIDTSTLSAFNNVILYIRPRSTDLTNTSSNSLMWTMEANTDFINSGNTATGTVIKIIGSGATAKVKTNGIGKITEVTMTSRGTGYQLLPMVSVKSPNNSAGLSILDLTPKNYLAKVKISSSLDAIGSGYAFGITEGIIYQKGFFERVASQTVIVDKYSPSPNAVAVGFSSVETIIDSNIDASLLSNVLGTQDENAPGANRLKITPELIVLDLQDAKADPEYFTLVEWNEGNPYKQNQLSAYSRIGDEMAQRMDDSAGNFVLDPFLVTTVSTSNAQNEGSYYTVVVDAGLAYIKGKRVKTNYNFRIDVPKGTDVQIANSQKISLNYDAFIRIKEVGGIFQFSTGDTIDLYDTVKGYLSNTALIVAANTTPQGTKIGTARIRSMVFESGVVGNPTSIFKLFLFNIQMISGYNFKNIKSVYYNGSSYKGIADVVLTLDPTTQANIAKIDSAENDTLVFRSGVESIKNSNNTTYIYRTIDQTTSVANGGILTKSIASTPDEFFPYSGALSNAQLKELYIVPLGNNLISYDSLTGDVSCDSSPNVVGTSTTFLSDLQAGDYVYLFPNTSAYDIKKVITVVNNTLVIVESNVGFANTSTTISRIFPKNLPVPFGTRSGLTANVDSNGNILTCNFGMTFDSASAITTALGVNIQRESTTSTSKTVNRNQFVKLQLSNNAANVAGPWCLGVADVFRLRSIHVGNSTVTTSDINITDEFYIDHNQTANYLDLSYLYLKPKSGLSLANTDFLLVEFDYYIRSGAGYFDTVSYLHTANAVQIAQLDSLPLANLSSAAASWEVPEVYCYQGDYYDLLNCIDFRPAVSNTAAPNTNAASAPINPVYAISFGNTADPANDKKFPLPDSLCTTNIEQYVGRTDSIIVGSDANIVVLRGLPNADSSKRFETAIPKNALKLQAIQVPPYPNISKNMSLNVVEVASTGISNERNMNARIKSHTLNPQITSNRIKFNQPQGYSMAKIGELERRIIDLEYYTSLSLLETNLTNKIIPSSIDGSINRFKFGFFVDDFSTAIYSDLDNPQYAADIEVFENIPERTANNLAQLSSNLLVPPKFQWNLKHYTDQIAAAYTDFLIVDQNNATDEFSTMSIPVQANAILYSSKPLNKYAGTPGMNGRTVVVTHMSTKPGPAVIYFDLLGDPIIKVYQSGAGLGAQLIATTSTSVELTAEEKVLLQTDPYMANFFSYAFTHPINIPLSEGLILWRIDQWGWAPDGFVVGVGKLTFSHNPTLGLDYTIVTDGAWWSDFDTPGSPQQVDLSYVWAMVYPVDITATAGVLLDPVIDGNPNLYNGTMRISMMQNAPPLNGGPTLSYDTIKMVCTGLKPNTTHFFFLDGISDDDNVKAEGSILGDPLISDMFGKLTVFYHVNDVWFNKVANAKLIPEFHLNASGEYLTRFDTNFVPSYALFEIKTIGSICFSEAPLLGGDKILF